MENAMSKEMRIISKIKKAARAPSMNACAGLPRRFFTWLKWGVLRSFSSNLMRSSTRGDTITPPFLRAIYSYRQVVACGFDYEDIITGNPPYFKTTTI